MLVFNLAQTLSMCIGRLISFYSTKSGKGSCCHADASAPVYMLSVSFILRY